MPATATRPRTTKCPECKLSRGKHLPECSRGGCQYCHAPVGHAPECPEYDGPKDTVEKPTLEVGARYEEPDGSIRRITASDGKTVEFVLEDLGDDAFSETRGQFSRHITRRLPDAIATDVDGKPAQVVWNGATGAPGGIVLDGARSAPLPPTSGELVDRIHVLASKRQELIEAETAKKRASEYAKAVQDEVNRLVDALVDAVELGRVQPSLFDDAQAPAAPREENAEKAPSKSALDTPPQTPLKDICDGSVFSLRERELEYLDDREETDRGAAHLAICAMIDSGELIRTEQEPTKATCRQCGCTDAHACDTGCDWVDLKATLCTACAAKIASAEEDRGADAISRRIDAAGGPDTDETEEPEKPTRGVRVRDMSGAE